MGVRIAKIARQRRAIHALDNRRKLRDDRRFGTGRNDCLRKVVRGKVFYLFDAAGFLQIKKRLRRGDNFFVAKNQGNHSGHENNRINNQNQKQEADNKSRNLKVIISSFFNCQFEAADFLHFVYRGSARLFLVNPAGAVNLVTLLRLGYLHRTELNKLGEIFYFLQILQEMIQAARQSQAKADA